MFCRLNRDHQGATAIEYAIIAALIGIGLIGTLVGTKTSLSAIFGVAATQMASGTGSGSGTSNAALGPRAPYWQSKTLSSTVNGVNGNGPYTTYTYSDGSFATLTKYNSGSVVNYLEVWDPKQPLHELYSIDANGVNNGIQVENRVVNADGSMGAYQGHVYSASINNGVIGSTGCGGNMCGSSNVTYLSGEQQLVGSDFQYFKGITPKIGG